MNLDTATAGEENTQDTAHAESSTQGYNTSQLHDFKSRATNKNNIQIGYGTDEGSHDGAIGISMVFSDARNDQFVSAQTQDHRMRDRPGFSKLYQKVKLSKSKGKKLTSRLIRGHNSTLRQAQSPDGGSSPSIVPSFTQLYNKKQSIDNIHHLSPTTMERRSSKHHKSSHKAITKIINNL